MVAEAMKRIRDAESAAAEERRRARATHKKAIADAHGAAEQKFNDMRQAARDEEKNLIEEASRTAQAEAEKLVEQSGADVERVRADGEARVESAIEKVMEAMTARA
ncbi:MAG: hypothetical protein JXB46_05190 [Candidatus Eisenbacteria bacterium]|nr:hypothetical protein [Candidatus Eisenbacteria bacterium]